MAPPHFNPQMFGTELTYTLIVVFLFLFVYFKTKEMYDLTKHRGIHLFRNAFLFFGLSYATRFVFQLVQLGALALDYRIPGMLLFPLVFPITVYLSTMAIFYLAYSMVWEKISHQYFLIASNIIAVGIAVAAYLTNSPMIIALVQLPLLIFTLVKSTKGRKKKKSHMKGLYFLVSLFWLVNLFVLTPRWFVPFEIKVLLQLASAAVFIFLAYKVLKWTG
ncbi:hypothetical protein JW711_01755 [Candidatus Woesearchaeota archaeon]|nr:hypothetical protein [Candidatus Woesearchaeota archaeon]